MPRGIRWETLHFELGFAPCFDLRQVLFGPDSAHVATMQSARKMLVRFPSDSVLFDKVEFALDRPWPTRGGGLPVLFGRGVAATTDLLIGGKRARSCLWLLSLVNS